MFLRNKVAIVTGAASGIGRAIALALGREGARVVIADIDLAGAEGVASQLRTSGARCFAARVDVSRSNEVSEMVEKTLRDFGRIDILVNNAAYLGFSVNHTRFMETDETEWNRHIDVTLKGTLHCIKAVVPHMTAQGGGRIINITSACAKLKAPPGEVLYSAVKAAVAGLSRCLAGELARSKILVNCVAPGFIMTPAVLATRPPEWQKMATSGIPLKMPGEPEDIAEMVAFLASDQAKYITGQHYSVDGGLSML